MSGIKALEKLREKIQLDVNNPWSDLQGDLLAMCDKLEAEIAERFMELPVDADGVPIREGDVVQFVNDAGGTGAAVEVCAISEHYVYYGEGKHFYRAVNCRHVEPRTVEDVLRDCCTEWNEHLGSDWETGVYAKYAAEIRELMGVDE